MISLNNISKSYNERLFRDVSFTIGKNRKIGLVGLNGCGKTTLFKLLTKKENPDTGSVEISKNERIGYLPQQFSFGASKTIDDFFKSFLSDYYSELWKAQVTAEELGLDLDDVKNIDELSEGNKMKLYLIKILYDDPTLLLLDEPTNHLDINGIMWCERFVKNFPGACMMTSHDREFLNNTVDRIFEIDKKNITIFEGNYDDYLIEKEKLIAKQNEQYLRQQKQKEKLEKLIEKSKLIKGGRKRGKAVRAAKKRLEREVQKPKINKYVKDEIKEIEFKGHVHNKKTIINVKDMFFSYSDEKEVFNDANYDMYGSERVWFYGPNGSGKSTFVKLLVGDLSPINGKVEIGQNLTWEYFSQDQRHLPFEKTIEEYVLSNSSMSLGELYGFLESFLFTKNMLNMKLGDLSPGQRARLNFAVFTRRKSQLLILDEPTNHLDIQTKDIIEKSLQEYEGAIFLISHDRYFAERVATDRKITIRDKQIFDI